MVNTNVHISRLRNGEHQLSATRFIPAGTLVIAEKPLVAIPLGQYRYGTYAWDLTDAILTAKTLVQKVNGLKLHVTKYPFDPSDLIIEAELVRKHRKSRQLIRQVYLTVCTNNIAALDEEERPVGYGMYELLSRSDHDCNPNTLLMGTDVAAHELGLRAKRDIATGEPVTWAYFQGADFAAADYESRNFNLLNFFRFVCRCDRCALEHPAELKGRNLVEYFDRLIKEHADAAKADPALMAELLAAEPMAAHARLHQTKV